jgi:hypothetical protein
MTLNRLTLAKIDKRILSQMDHDEGVQLVKVPVSDAVWSTWRRYCDAVGIPMGRALAVLLHRELASVVEEGLEHEAELLADRARRLNERDAALAKRELDLENRERRISPVERPVGAVGPEPKPHPLQLSPAAVLLKVGRNELCLCGSGLTYKRCHGA